MRALWIGPYRQGFLTSLGRPVTDVALPGDRLPRPHLRPDAGTVREMWCRGGCGRLLTDETSKSRGYGPVCWKRLHGRTTRLPGRRTAPRRTLPAPAGPLPAIPGQAEFELVDHQPTLWSL